MNKNLDTAWRLCPGFFVYFLDKGTQESGSADISLKVTLHL